MTANTPHPPQRADDRDVRVGVFWSVHEAEVAVRLLLAEGFDKSLLTVVAADEEKRAWLREWERDDPAGTSAPRRAAKGSVVGAIVGGLVGLVGVATSGPEAMLLEPIWVGTGAAFGTFVGAMTSRGVEREVANYFDQALRRGQVLVAAEIPSHGDPEMLRRAERVFEEMRKHPVSLPKG